ncbi:2,3-epoxybenzoyl-CoA dihydrolase [Myxococcota bacterium]|nr:2,3-epoxybenzoyl-CoA dihydrolase [Myxococcota bacterium]
MGHDAHLAPPPSKLGFDTHPDRYVHWKLTFDGPIAKLDMNVQQEKAMREGEYILKLNSYDLGVDMELADAVQRVRFEHPEVRCLIVGSAQDRIFCSGANIYMLGSSTHAFKVNFCKYTNETRLSLESLPDDSGIATICAVNGTASGGGYELALACEKIMLIDDGNSAVSFPEAPLLAVLPGTGGLTRLVDKRKVRRDLADVFSTIAEGIKGKRAVQWNLVDELVPRSKWAATLATRAQEAAAKRPEKKGPGITLPAVGAQYGDGVLSYEYVTLKYDRAKHTAHLTVKAPTTPQPETAAMFHEVGARAWVLKAFRELDDALLRVRFELPEVSLVVLHTEGEIDAVLAADEGLAKAEAEGDWLAHEIRLNLKRVLKRLDLSAKSLFALVEPKSCFAGSLFEMAIASDRIFMLNSSEKGVHVALSSLCAKGLEMATGLTRLETRFLGTPAQVKEVLAHVGKKLDTETAEELGLVTFAPDDIDWEDEVRIAIEERANFSPDAMTGMEANLRFAGPETMETKIFGRLSAWQNWIFQRPNAVGEKGALTLYGKQMRPEFDMNRT